MNALIEELLDGAAKPPKSLGLLEKYISKLFTAWGTIQQDIRPFHLIFASDNGVVEAGVVNFPAEITYLQAKNMAAGRATISCFCQANGIEFSVVDVGINHNDAAGINRKAAYGTRNILEEEAMSPAEFQKAWDAGREMVQSLAERGYNLISFGEMGIGNTTTSSAVLHALTGMLPEYIVGFGASGNDNEVLKRKRVVVAEAVARHNAGNRPVEDILRCVGGFDIVALCAAMLTCVDNHIPFVIDGFITAVAYACAARINRQVEHYAIPSHMSREPGMAYSLLLGNILVDDVPICAHMALGEGTGAILMVSMLKTMHYAVFHTARLSELTQERAVSS